MPEVYEIHFYGGPLDGQMTYGFRPYFRLVMPEGTYEVRADHQKPDDYVQWIDDDTRRIDMEVVNA